MPEHRLRSVLALVLLATGCAAADGSGSSTPEQRSLAAPPKGPAAAAPSTWAMQSAAPTWLLRGVVAAAERAGSIAGGSFVPLASCDATLCDDQNPCTSDFCSLTAGCLHRNKNRQTCSDGNACTINDRCLYGACLAGVTKVCRDGSVCTTDFCQPASGCHFTPVECDDGNPCSTDVCDSQLGCFFVSANGTPCEDGNPCTSGDFCAAKKCFSGTPNPCDDGNPCTVDSCDAELGCEHTAIADGTSCSNNDVCDGAEVCGGGVCLPGVSLDCDDSNQCTADTCDPISGCANTNKAIGTACDDADACTLGETCTAGACGGGAAKTCGDENPCTDDTCEPAVGCVFTPNDANSCDDARICTAADRCEAGSCVGDYVTGCCESDAQCDDGTACSSDACDEVTGVCSNDVDVSTFYADGFTDGSITDWVVASSNPDVTWQPSTADSVSPTYALYFGNAAAGSYDFGQTLATATTPPIALPTWSQPVLRFSLKRLTDAAEFCPYDAFAVRIGDEIVYEECGASEGGWLDLEVDLGAFAGQTVALTFEFDTVDPGFNDGVGVFVDDVVVSYAGGPTATCCDGPTDCDDGDPCTVDSCGGLELGAGFCSNVPKGICCEDDLGCDDSDPCTVDSCVGGACQSVAVASGGACDDGDACTVGETCQGGQCQGGGPLSCPDDGDPCTVEQCDSSQGCTASLLACDDGVACTVDACTPGEGCASVPVANLCTEGTACQSAVCSPTVGCVYSALANGAACDAGACVTGATCAGGTCSGGAPVECDDGNPCTGDFCDPVAGCQYADAGGCDDGLSCSEDLCDPAVGCVFVASPKFCADGNPCTLDLCGPGGCQNVPVTDGVACKDPCGGAGLCNAGQCSGGATGCDDGNACTDDWCDLAGCVHDDISWLCEDGDACTVDACDPSGACTHEALPSACDDSDPCTVDACGEEGCSHEPLPDGALCDDGDACTTSACSLGLCVAFAQPGCDDGDACTKDTCDPAGGCSHAPLCDDGEPCTADSCVAGACSHVAASDGQACDDGDPCTSADACAGGACGGSTVAGCCHHDGECAVACSVTECQDNACVTLGPAAGAFLSEAFAGAAPSGWTFEATAGQAGWSVSSGPSQSPPSALRADLESSPVGQATGGWRGAVATTPVVFAEPGAELRLSYSLRTDWAADCASFDSFVSVYVNGYWVLDECSTAGEWVTRELDLSGMSQSGTGQAQVRFEVWSIDAPGNGGTVAIDDVVLFDPGAGPSSCCTEDAQCPGDDGNPCTARVCSDPGDGGLCVTRYLPMGVPCDDGDPQTSPDACLSGACGPFGFAP